MNMLICQEQVGLLEEDPESDEPSPPRPTARRGSYGRRRQAAAAIGDPFVSSYDCGGAVKSTTFCSPSLTAAHRAVTTGVRLYSTARSQSGRQELRPVSEARLPRDCRTALVSGCKVLVRGELERRCLTCLLLLRLSHVTRSGLLFTISLIFTATFYFVKNVCWPSLAATSIALSFSVLSLGFLLLTGCSNPGFVTTSVPETQARRKYCDRCQIYTAPGTGHCEDCNCCIEQLDRESSPMCKSLGSAAYASGAADFYVRGGDVSGVQITARGLVTASGAGI